MTSGSKNPRPWLTAAPGAFRHRITIQGATTAADASGQKLSTWSNVYYCWANIRVINAREVAQNSFLTSEVSHVIEIRWPGPTPLISPGMRVQFAALSSTVYYQIQAIENPEQRNIQLNLICVGLNSAE